MAYTSTDLTNVETAIRNRVAGGGVISYSIGSRALKYLSLAELRSLRDEIKAELQKDLYPTGAALGKFRRPS